MTLSDTQTTGTHIRAARGNFLAMAGTYALGAFNDNFFKQAACLLAISANMDELQGAAAALFTVPFILFAAPAGFMADRFPKRNVVIAAKALELAAMICGAIGMCIGNWPLILMMVFIMGLQATIFSPALNGSIPELYPPAYVLKANSFMKMATTIAILLGIVLAGPAVGQDRIGWHGVTVGRLIVAGGVLAAAMLGLAISLGVPARPAANPRARFPWRGPWDTVRDLAHMRSDKLLAGIVALDAYVWFVAALQVLLINRMGKQFHLDKADTSFMLAPELAGVALGGLVIGKLSGSRRWFRVLAPAALAMGAVMLAVAGTPALPNQEQGISPQFIAACALFFFTGLAGGILLVPLEAFIQARPAPDRKGQVIAAANFTAFIGIMLAGLADIILGWYMSPTAAFGLLGAATLLAGAVVWKATKQTIDAKPQAEGQSNT